MRAENLMLVRLHAAREQPRESCGVLLIAAGRERYLPCRNMADGANHFIINPSDWARAEDRGEIVAVVHSHVGTPPLPSMADRVQCEQTGLPWIIVNWPTGSVNEFKPERYEAPLVGREFCHGVLDCYSLVRDYYKQECRIELPDFDRDELWWEKGGDLYLDNFETAGFVEVFDPLKKHDVILMQVASSRVNHSAVYLGDAVILQHLMKRLSSRDIYGGYWQKCTRKIVRHQTLL